MFFCKNSGLFLTLRLLRSLLLPRGQLNHQDGAVVAAELYQIEPGGAGERIRVGQGIVGRISGEEHLHLQGHLALEFTRGRTSEFHIRSS